MNKNTVTRANVVLRRPSGKLCPARVRRNELCPCGSGRKFKKCCLKGES